MSTRYDDSARSSRHLEREAEESRARIEGLLDQLGGHLSPDRLMEQAKDYLQKGPGAFGGNLGAVVRDNPVPVVLAGLGLGWLALAGRHSSPQGGDDDASRDRASIRRVHGDTASDLDPSRPVSSPPGVVPGTVRDDEDARSGLGTRAKAADEGVRGAAQNAAERLGDVGGQLHQRAARAQDQAGRAARQTGDGFMRVLTEQPLVVAGLGVALGALLGAALPATARENELLGETSDELKQRARAFGHEQMDKVSEAVAAKTDEAGPARPDERPATPAAPSHRDEAKPAGEAVIPSSGESVARS